MNQDSQFTVKFHHERFLSIRNNLGFEIYELNNNLNLHGLKTKEMLRKTYKRTEEVKMVEPLLEKFLIAVIKQNDGDFLELRNTQEEEIIYRSNRYSTPVLSIGSNRDKLLVCIEISVFLYSLTKERHHHYAHTLQVRMDTPYIVTTSSNLNGIFALGNKYFAVPNNSISGIIKIFTINNKYSTRTLRAHREAVGAIAFDSSEDFIAMAPISGTVILVYYRYTVNGQPLFTFQRGNFSASISSLCFNKELGYLACSSNKTTIHIFRITEDIKTYWMDYIFSCGERAYYTAQLPKADLNSCLLLKSISPLKLLVLTNEGVLKLYTSVKNNARGTELTMIKEEMLDLAVFQ